MTWQRGRLVLLVVAVVLGGAVVFLAQTTVEPTTVAMSIDRPGSSAYGRMGAMVTEDAGVAEIGLRCPGFGRDDPAEFWTPDAGVPAIFYPPNGGPYPTSATAAALCEDVRRDRAARAGAVVALTITAALWLGIRGGRRPTEAQADLTPVAEAASPLQ